MQPWSTHGAQVLALRRLQHPTAPASHEASAFQARRSYGLIAGRGHLEDTGRYGCGICERCRSRAVPQEPTKDHGGNGVHHCPICKGQMNSRATRRGYCDIHFVLCHSPNHAGQEFPTLKGTNCIKCVEITAATEAKEAKERKVRREKQVADAIEKKKAEGAKKAGGGGK
nr:hypothetical protein B0A51_07487 [Rachicladosporium sp. CCFEE 5018]